MNIVIPMAGAGQRFKDCGYMVPKPAIPTIDRRTGKEVPMVVCAVMDLPFVEESGSNVIFIDRTFHKQDGVETEIVKYFNRASFLTVEQLTAGQACTCLLAKSRIDNEEPLLIAGCDNGMVFDTEKLEKQMGTCDMVVFTYRHNQAVLADPNAYGWVETDGDGRATGVSVKKAISDTPMEDHAIVATFWFRHGSDFVRAAEKMIAEDDRVNGEFYVDEVIGHALELGLFVRVFEVDRYLGWGTPKDYEEYQKTVRYWRRFVAGAGFLPGPAGC